MKYAKSGDGIIHLINPLQGEHTLCGDAFDIDSEPGNELQAWVERNQGPVTCGNCALVIKSCRGIRIKI